MTHKIKKKPIKKLIPGYCEIARHFGPFMLRTKLTDELIEDFNNAVDEVVSDKEESLKRDWSDYLVGKVSQEFTLPTEVISKHSAELQGIFTAYTDRVTPDWIRTHNESAELDDQITQEFVIKSNWAVRSFKGDYNPIHMHPNGDLVCVGYLKLPDWDEELATDHEDHYPANGQINWVQGEPLPYSQNTMMHLPEVGDFWVFPAWLQHMVYPFRSEGERRSFSFNIIVNKVKNNKIVETPDE